MTVDYWYCGMCGVQLMIGDQSNVGRFPAVRRFEDERNHKGLIAVRCSHCADMPYLLEEGQPHRVDLIGNDNVPVLIGCNSEYNYYPLGIGHLLEAFVSAEPSDEWLGRMRNEPIEIGVFVEEKFNLIVVEYRLGESKFNVTPYCWHAQGAWRRGTPPVELTSENDCNFTVAYVSTTGGKYRVIRHLKMSQEFAQELNSAIHQQIERGEPDWEPYRRRAENLGSLLFENKAESLLTARCVLTD